LPRSSDNTTKTPSAGRDSDRGGSLTISIPSTLAGLKQGFSALGAWLDRHSIGGTVNDNANLVFEEIVNNISRYAFSDGREHLIEVLGRLSESELALTFDDGGRPFDPRNLPAPKQPQSLEEATIGGRGIMLVKSVAKRLDYERTAGGHNRLTVTLDRNG
jgi:anti-sigma regulatory factor (Ser/Thr protein kinase)